MNIYQKSGYIDIRAIMALGMPFNFIVGGRATGKTYTSLETVKEDGIKFIYMRRTQSQADMINKPEFSPFKSLNEDHGWAVGSATLSKYNAGFYETEETEDGGRKCVGSPIGYTCALSTISNMRGFDASDVRLLIYDEFIPEKHERPIKNEGAAFLNAYETINRNRELKGQKPLQVLCLANANDLANPIFLELGLVRKAEQMRRKGQEISIDKDRGVGLFILDKSPISAQKRDTALYKLSKYSEFSRMALENDFSNEDIGRIKTQPIGEYRPIVTVGEITVYKHKSRGEYYVSTHKAGSCIEFGSGDTDKNRFRRAFGWLWQEYMKNNIVFEEYLCEVLLNRYFC